MEIEYVYDIDDNSRILDVVDFSYRHAHVCRMIDGHVETHQVAVLGGPPREIIGRKHPPKIIITDENVHTLFLLQFNEIAQFREKTCY